MKNILILFAVIFLAGSSSLAQSDCVKNAEVVEPTLSKEVKDQFDLKLAKAAVNLTAKKTLAAVDKLNKTSYADELIWVGRRHAYLGRYKSAIEAFSEGVTAYPKDARFYRHRGHRYITLRCFDDAIKDFETAARLIKGKPDEVEPDGLPNARNIPTSTLQSNIWYHLGLAYYLKSDFKNALKAYVECLKVSKNPDMLVATTNWLYVTLRRLDKKEEADKYLVPIKDDLDIIENDSYYDLIKLYKQGRDRSYQEFYKRSASNTAFTKDATLLYGYGNWFLINDSKEIALYLFQGIVTGDQWSSFGFIAAEAELNRQKRDR